MTWSNLSEQIDKKLDKDGTLKPCCSHKHPSKKPNDKPHHDKDDENNALFAIFNDELNNLKDTDEQIMHELCLFGKKLNEIEDKMVCGCKYVTTSDLKNILKNYYTKSELLITSVRGNDIIRAAQTIFPILNNSKR